MSSDDEVILKPYKVETVKGNLNGEKFVGLLRRLLHHGQRPIFLIVGRYPARLDTVSQAPRA